jgi:NAD(P)H-hydrate repair Nnr-like enzyme with NAD(P)H-hydrate dehydratase domain
MSQDYWQQQTDKPLFPDLLWSRPETRQGAGKLLIIGGQAQEFSHVAECYSAADQAGAGTIRVLMPESTRKSTKHLPNIEYAPSNQSGSFGREALSTLLDASQWANGVLLAGDLGKNSETTLMLEGFIAKYTDFLVMSAESLSAVQPFIENLFNRHGTLLILDTAQLQKAAIKLQLQKPITSDMSHANLAEALHEITKQFLATIMVRTDSQTWTSSSGRVASSPNKNVSITTLAAKASVWAIQNPTKIFEAVTTSLCQDNLGKE